LDSDSRLEKFWQKSRPVADTEGRGQKGSEHGRTEAGSFAPIESAHFLLPIVAKIVPGAEAIELGGGKQRLSLRAKGEGQPIRGHSEGEGN